VAELPAGRHLFTKGAVIPELHRPPGDFDNDGFSDALELKTGGDVSIGITPLSGRHTPTGAGTGAPSTTVPPDAGALMSPVEDPADPTDAADALGTDRYQTDARQALDEDDPLGAPGDEDLDAGRAYAADPFGDSLGYATTSGGADSPPSGSAGDGSAYDSTPYDGSDDAGSAPSYGGPSIGGTYTDASTDKAPAQADPGSGSDDSYVSFDDDPDEASDEPDAGFYDDTYIT
jgi:hypothetical protein